MLKGILFAFGYLDDIFVLSENTEKHFKHLRTTSNSLRMVDIKLKRIKCDFFKCELHYLGHLVSGKGIYPLPEKLQSIKNLLVAKHL